MVRSRWPCSCNAQATGSVLSGSGQLPTLQLAACSFLPHHQHHRIALPFHIHLKRRPQRVRHSRFRRPHCRCVCGACEYADSARYSSSLALSRRHCPADLIATIAPKHTTHARAPPETNIRLFAQPRPAIPGQLTGAQPISLSRKRHSLWATTVSSKTKQPKSLGRPTIIVIEQS